MKKPLTIVVLGRSGSGKGVQVGLLARKIKPVLIVRSGAYFRALARHKTLAGNMVRNFIKKGHLAPDWLASYIWIDALIRKLDQKKSVILDGSPRMKEEARLLDEVLGWLGRHNVIALYIDVSEKEVTRRLMLRGRSDDRPAAIKNRLAFFNRNVMPAIQYYKKTKRLIHINGEQSIQEVHADICKIVHVPV